MLQNVFFSIFSRKLQSNGSFGHRVCGPSPPSSHNAMGQAVGACGGPQLTMNFFRGCGHSDTSCTAGTTQAKHVAHPFGPRRRCFNCWNFLSLKPVYISNDYLTINGEQIEWENILSVDNKLIDEVGLFGNIKTTDERILEIRKVGKVQAPIILSDNFYPVEEIFQKIKAKKD